MKYYIPDLLDGYAPEAEPVSAPDMEKLRGVVAAKLAQERGAARKPPRRVGKTLLIAAAVAALLSVTALAAAFGGFDWLRDEVEPEFIDAVEPVEQSVTDKGIRFGVIAAQKYEDTTLVYFSLTDVDGLGRVNEDSEPVLTRNYYSNAECVYYDAEKQTAVYEAKFDASEPLGVTAILNNRRKIEPVQIDTSLAEAYLYGERIGESEFINFQTMPDEWLTPGYVAEIPGAEGAYVSAIGDNGRLLAVQYCRPIRYDGSLGLDTLLTPYLMDAGGNRIDTCLNGSVTSPYEVDGMGTTERYFKVDAETLAGCTLWFEGSTCETVVDGDWTLDPEDIPSGNIVQVTADIVNDGGIFHDAEITLSPIGMVVDWKGEDIKERLTTPDTAILETSGGEIVIWRNSGNISRYLSPASPIDPSAVTAIRIGGTVIELD